MAHVHTVRLAAMARRGMPFPDHGEELAPAGSEDSCLEFGVTGAVILGGRYLQFTCHECGTVMFQCNTPLGVRHARKISSIHAPCCKERQAKGITGIWPGPDEE